MNIRNMLAAAALAGAAAATWYWSRPPAPVPVARSPRDSAPLGYYMRGAHLFRADDDGRIFYTITAERAEELPGEQGLDLTGVTIRYRPETDVSWLVSAGRGTAPRSGLHLTLSDNVQLANDPGDGRPPTVVTASTLRLDELTAESSETIEVKIGNDVLRAVGLKVDLKADNLQLESDGHGRFTP
jgi:LPS export ABC transporter protein LptC